MNAEWIKTWTCENDYVERGGAVEELTVTITLSEYRELIAEAALKQKRLEQLEAENENLQERHESLSKLLIAKHPELLQSAFRAVNDFMAATEEFEEAETDETAGGK